MRRTIEKPIFIIGSPRSGTTLMRLLVNGHADCCVPPECGFAIWWENVYSTWTVDDGFDAITSDIVSSKKFETWKIGKNVIVEGLVSRQPKTYAEVIDSIYRTYCESVERPNARWGDKNNYYLHHIETIVKIFPDALFLHIVRDGRDVACSYRELHQRAVRSEYAPNLPCEISEIATEWAGNVSKISKDLGMIDSSKRTTVRYEDLVNRPNEAANDICDFLSIPFDENMLNFFLHEADYHREPNEFLAWKEKTQQPISTVSVGRYKTELTLRDVSNFEKFAGNCLELYGYALEETK